MEYIHYIGFGAMLAILLTSTPYLRMLDYFKLDEIDFLQCGLCLGTHTAIILSITYLTFDPFGFSLVPLTAYTLSKYIRK